MIVDLFNMKQGDILKLKKGTEKIKIIKIENDIFYYEIITEFIPKLRKHSKRIIETYYKKI